MSQPERCEDPGCFEVGYECVLPDETAFTYCSEHAFKNGFCKCCGQFFAGIERFDFGNGYCDNCRDQYEYEEHVYEGDLAEDVGEEPDWTCA